MSISGGNLAGNGKSFERSNPLARCKSFEYRAKENEYYRTKGLPSDNCWRVISKHSKCKWILPLYICVRAFFLSTADNNLYATFSILLWIISKKIGEQSVNCNVEFIVFCVYAWSINDKVQIVKC